MSSVLRQRKQTAAERFADIQNDIGAILDLIGEEIRVHAGAVAEKPNDWSYAGDLARIREGLKGILESLIIDRHARSESDASRFIENHLENMREHMRRE